MLARGVVRLGRSSLLKSRVFSTSCAKFYPRYPNRTRVTKEISEEEVKAFQRQNQNYEKHQEQAYYRTQPSSNAQEFEGEPSQFHTVFEIPPNPDGLINPNDGIFDLLKEPTLVIERQLEMMNLILGFEQANRYKILNSMGQQIGYMEEKDIGIGKMIARQFFRLHRPFDVDVFNMQGDKILTISRKFSFINSHIKALLPGYDENDQIMHEVIGESVQSWHLWRRRYNLFKLDDDVTDEYNQFGDIDAPFLSFDFPVKNQHDEVIGSVDRNWVGLGREMFTDTGVYVIRMDPASFAGLGHLYPKVAGPMTLDQRAVLLANAVSIDFDYFSRHSRSGGGFFGGGGGSYE